MKQKRSLIVLVLVFCFALCLPGCKPKEVDESKLSVFELQSMNWKREEILSAMEEEEAWRSSSIYEWAQRSDAPENYTYDGFRYYGTFGDALVWMAANEQSAKRTYTKIGYAVFGHPCEMRLYLYAEGEILLLENAYEQGKITREDLVAVARRHWEYNKAVEALQAPQETTAA